MNISMFLIVFIIVIINTVNGQYNASFPGCALSTVEDTGVRWTSETGSEVHYTNIADIVQYPNSGLNYILGRSPFFQDYVDIVENTDGFLPRGAINGPGVNDLPSLGTDTHNGIAIFDYDGDCDLDIFVSNTLGHANSLFQNQMFKHPPKSPRGCAMEIEDRYTDDPKDMRFIDVAVWANVAEVDHNSAGPCFGDIDNDGDQDLIILGRRGDVDLLFINNGDGTFKDGVEFYPDSDAYSSEGCAFGDLNNDGLLDLFIGAGSEFVNTDERNETFRWHSTDDPELVKTLQDPNSLFLNNGDNTFDDITLSSGIRDVILDNGGCYPDSFNGIPTITHHQVILDINQDGCNDIIHADEGVGNIQFPRGNIHVWLNNAPNCDQEFDGHLIEFINLPIMGNDRSIHGLPPRATSMMGMAWGDLNCDGNLDFIVSDLGSYGANIFINARRIPADPPIPVPGLNFATQWVYGNGDGTFVDPFNYTTRQGSWANPFGWGTAMFDYDNDGDLDILTHGGLSASAYAMLDNPGFIWNNQGCGSEDPETNKYDGVTFTLDKQIYDTIECLDDMGNSFSDFCTPHNRREVYGVAIGDLNGDGKMDIVSTAAATFGEENFPRFKGPFNKFAFPIFQDPDGFDETALWFQTWAQINSTHSQFLGKFPDQGDVYVEIMDGENNNNWVKFTIRGSKGILPNGKVNRDAITTRLTFEPRNMPRVLQVITGGDSHISANALERIFGMKDSNRGDLYIRFQGNVWNAFFRARRRHHYIIYEIPCDFKDNINFTKETYARCVDRNTKRLRNLKFISTETMRQMRESNKKAWKDCKNDPVECAKIT